MTSPLHHSIIAAEVDAASVKSERGEMTVVAIATTAEGSNNVGA